LTKKAKWIILAIFCGIVAVALAIFLPRYCVKQLSATQSAIQSDSSTRSVPKIAAAKKSSYSSTRPVYKIAAAKKSSSSCIPLKKDGIPAKPKKDFLALKSRYNLLLVPTYDGSNQETHPKLLYFKNGWNGYRYWMSMTPYPSTNDKFENPSIVVSNDLKTWVVPKGLKNPVTGLPSDVKHGGYYSDPQLVMNGDTMELWFRYVRGNPKTGGANYRCDYYYRMKSTDGIHWSRPCLMQSSKKAILSLAIVYREGKYQFWYRDNTNHLMYAESVNGVNWVNFHQCQIPLPKGFVPWHQDVVLYKGKYYLLQTALYRPHYSFSLFLAESTDGVNFTRGVKFYPSEDPIVLHKAWLYRSTFVPTANGLFPMVVSYCLPGRKWFMTRCTISRAIWDNACMTGKAVTLRTVSA